MKKKILFLMPSLYTGGAERILRNTLSVISKEKYDITLILIKGTNEAFEGIPPCVHCRFLTDDRNPKQYIWFRRLSKYHIFYSVLYKIYIKQKFDVEIAFLEGIATHLIARSTNRKSKKIAYVHTDMINNPWSNVDFRSEKQQKHIYKNFNHIVCVSEYGKEQFRRRFGEGFPLIFLHNVIQSNEIINKAEELMDDIPIRKKITLVSAGRLVEQKGFDRLILVHKGLISNGIDNVLWIIGDGSQRNDLELLISRNKLEDSVKLLGLKKNPYPYIKNADLYVCSSRSEGYSTVVCEALILGTPVISVKVSGTDEILGGGKYGMIVDNNERALLNGLTLMLTNKNLLKKYKKMALERRNFFSSNFAISELEKLIDD